MIERIILVLVVTFGATRAQSGCNSKTDVTFLLDSSDNVGKDNFQKQLAFIKDVTNNFQVAPDKVQVSAVTFGTGATNQFYLNQYTDKVAMQNAIDTIQFKGGQAKIANAIRYATGTSYSPIHGGRADAPHVAVLLTNEPSGTIDMTKLESQTARDNGVILYTVGIGGATDPNELMAIASDPDSRHMFTAQNFDAMSSLSGLLAQKICNELPPDPALLPAPTSCLTKADLVFMVDSSSSIGSTNFQKLEHFLKSIVNKINVGPNNVQVGVVKYSSYPSLEMSLGQYQTRPEVMKALESMAYVGGGTNDGDAITFTGAQVFNQNSGARGDVPRIGVMITDGGSSNPTAAVAAANKARTENIGLIAVGVGNGVNQYELNNLADKPSSANVFTVNSYDNLDSITDNIIAQMCTIKAMQPSLTGATLPPDPCTDVLANCDQYGTNVCTDYAQWAGANCARTCGICTPLYTVAPPKCEDKFPNCASYGRDNCAVAGSFVQQNCELFCGLCGQNTSSSGYYGKCSYKGKTYSTGETWYDACDYECLCEDGNTGRYKCTNRCPVFHDLPTDCTLVAQPGKCCLKPVCNFNPTVNTQVSSGHGMTTSGIDVCEFKGKQYFQDQFWRDGCDYQCQCTDSKKGTYKCDDLCPTFHSIPPYCHLEKKAGECCDKPVCEFDSQTGSFGGYGSISGNGVGATPTPSPPCFDALPTCSMYSKSVCFGTYRGWANINCRKYCDMCPNGFPQPGPDDRCIFNGKLYSQGDTWNTSCSTTCTCENSIYGYYRCVDACPNYNNLPSNCHVIKTAGQCCPTLRCDSGYFLSSQTNPLALGNGGSFSVVNPPAGMIQVKPTLPSGEKVPVGSGTSGFTAPTLSGCLYKGQLYYQDQAWEDGCQYTCICKDAGTGLYSCKEKCPTYPVLPPSCHMKPDENDICCKSPDCQVDPVTHLIPVPIPVFQPAVQKYGEVVPPSLTDLHHGLYTKTITLLPTGFTPAPPTAGTNFYTGGIGICTYRGQTYKQGQVWEDGCDFNCVCDDASRGHYQCTEKCVHFPNLPKQCYLIKDPSNPCCDIPKCNFEANYITHIGEVKTTTPRPLGEYCVYEGARYQQGQTWYDGCSYKCTCEDALENVYRCLSRCPEYENVAVDCKFVSDPKDPSCCVMPECPETGVPQGPNPLPTPAPHGTYTGQGTGKGYCEYKNVHYGQGQQWQDGCDLTCTCTDSETGFYRCSEQCQRYINIPEYCVLVTDFANPCCKKPKCNFPPSIGGITGTGAPTTTLAPTPLPPGQTPVPHVGPTPAPHYRYCEYKGSQYFQGESWEDGCQYRCRCDNADKGLYVCNERCATYDTVPATCTFVTNPEDTCCLVPSCPPPTTPAPIPGSPTPQPNPNLIPTAAPGKITGSANVPSPKPGMTPPPINYCEYKGQQFSQGQKWDDGCDYTCECIDAATGKYQCLEKCHKYVDLPASCRLVKDPANPCCYLPECGEVTPAPLGTPAPSAMPTPPPHVCMYKGQPYYQGQTWYDGCEYECICENEMTGVYTCNDRCPQYGQLPAECSMVPSSADPVCCKEPKCDFVNTKNQTTGYLTPPTPPPGVISGGVATPTPKPSLAPSPGTPTGGPTPPPRPPVCIYKGNEYQTGQRWSDGCDYNCICDEGMTGHYTCTEMCSKFDDLPAGCRLVNDPYNPCCKKAYCPAKNVPTPAPPGAPSPSPTPTIGCMYNKVLFRQGEQWNDGCDLQCICEDEMSGFYRCRDRCSKYELAEGCTYITDPRDSCCKVPYCNPVAPTPAPFIPGMVPTPAPGVTYAPDKIPTPAPGYTYAPGQFPTWVPGMVPTPAPGVTYAPNKIPTPAPGYTYPPGQFPTYVPGMVPTPQPGFTYAPDKIPTPAPGVTYAPGYFPTWVPGMVPTPAPGVTFAPNKIPTPAPGYTFAPGQFPTWVPGMIPTPAPGVTFAPNKIPTPAPGYTFPPGQFPTYVPGMEPTPAPGVTFAPDKIPTPAPGSTYAPGYFPTWVPGMVPTPAPGITYAPNMVPTPAPGSTYKPGYFPTYVPGMVPTPAPGFTFAPNKIPTPAPGSTYKPGYFPTWVPGMVPTPAPGITFAPNKIPTPAPGRTFAPGQFPTWVPGMVPTPAPGYTFPPFLVPTPAPGKTYAPGMFPEYTTTPYPTPGVGLTYPTLAPGMVPTPAPGSTYAPNIVPTPAPGSTYAPHMFPTYVPGMVPTPAPGKTFPPWYVPAITPAPGSTFAPFQYPTWVPGMVPTPAPGVTYAPDKLPTPAPGKTYAPWNFPTYVPGMVPTPQPGFTYAPNMIPTPAPGFTFAPGHFPTWVPGMVPTPAPGFTYAPNKIPTPAPGSTYKPGYFPTYVPGMVPTPAPGVTFAPNKIPTPAPGFTYAPGKFPTWVPGMIPTPAPGVTYAPNMIPTPAPGSTFKPGYFPTYVPGMLPTPAPGVTFAPNMIPTPAPGSTYKPGYYPTYVPGMVPTPAPGVTYAPNKIPTPAPGSTYKPGFFPTWVPGMVPTPAPGVTFAPNMIPTPAPGSTYKPGYFPTYVPGMVPTPAPGVTYAPNKIPTPAPGSTYAPGHFPTWVPGMVPTPAPGYTFPPFLVPTPAPGKTYAPGMFPEYTTTPYPTPGVGLTYPTLAPGMVPTPAPGSTYAPNIVPTPAPGSTYAPHMFPTYVPGMVPTPAPGKTFPPWYVPAITPAPGSTFAPFQYPTWVPGMVPTPAPGVTYAPDKLPTPAPGKTYAPWNFPTYVPGMVPTPQPGFTYAPNMIPTPAPGFTFAPGQFPTWLPGMVPTPAPGVTYAPNKIPTPAPGSTYKPGYFPTYVPGMVPTPAPGVTYAPNKIPTPAPGYTYAPGQFPTWVPGMVPTPAPGVTYAPNKIPTPAPGFTFAPGQFPTYVPGMVPTPAPGVTYSPYLLPTPAPGRTYAPGQYPTWVPGMVPTPAPGVTYAPDKIPTPAPGRTYAPGYFPTYVPGMVPTPAPGLTYAPSMIPTPAPGSTFAPGQFPTWVPGMIPTPAPGFTYAPNMIPTPAPGSTYKPGYFPTYVPGMVPTPAPGVTYAPNKIPTPAPGYTYAPGHFPTYVPGMVPTPAPGVTYAPDKIPTPAPGSTYAPGYFPTWVPGMVPTPAPGYTFPPFLVPTPAPGKTYAPGMFPEYTTTPYPTPGVGLTYPTLAPGMVPTPAPGSTYAPNIVPTPAPGSTYAPHMFPTYVPGMVPTPAPGKTFPPWYVPAITPAPGSTFAPFQYPTWVPGMVPTPAPGVTYAPDKLPTPAPGKTYAPWNFPTYVPGMVPTPQPGFTYAPNMIPTPAPGFTYAPGQFPTWLPGMVPTPAPGFTYAPNKIPTPAPGSTYKPGYFPTYVPGMVPTPAPGVTYAPNKIPTPAPGYTYAPGQFPTWVPGMVPTPAPGVTYAPNKIPTPAPGYTYAPGQFPTYVPGMVPTPQPGFTYAPNMIPTPAPGYTYAPGQFPTWLPGMVPTPAPGVTYAPNKIPTPAPGYTYAPGQFPTWVPGMVPTPAPGVTFAPNMIPTPAPGYTYMPGQYPTWFPGMVPTPAPGQTYAPNLIPTPGIGLTYAPGKFPTPSPAPTPFPVPTAIPGVFQGSGVNGGNVSGCVHYGVVYKKGDIWQDGCKYDCECLDDHTGRYQCRERCPLFLNLPSYCRLVVDQNDACCKVPVCVTPGPPTPAPQPQVFPTPGPTPAPIPGQSPTPGPNPGPTPGPTPGPIPTPQPKEVCIMNGKQYVAGQTWYMGCDQRCVCEDGKTGFYRCYDRCAKFNNVSSSCTMVPDPNDPTCCKVPQCIPIPGPGRTVPTDKPFTVTGVPGVVSGHGTPPPPGTGTGFTSAPRNVCVYDGRMYTQGQKWQDGCNYNCVCVDGMTGKYDCTERCSKFPFVPPECTMRRDPNDVCCFRPICDYNQTVPTQGPFPQPTLVPGQSTINPLPPSYCVYKGVPYSQGQTWDDGCTKKCRCDDADMNIYTCFDRCKSYNSMPGCVMVSDPMDSCCQVPKCTKVPPTAGPTVCPYPMPTAIPGIITGGPQPDPITGVAPSNVGYCEYRGSQYTQGQTWDDGCSYQCQCMDANSGQYQCQERCARYVGLPTYCKMAQDPSDKCCTKPACDVCPMTPPPGLFTPTPGPPGPSQSPTPAPAPKEVCIMNGNQYAGGQKWYVGCSQICVCDDGKTGTYSCTERCPTYQNTAGCTMVPDPNDPVCCQAPSCPGNTGVIGTVNGSGTPPPPTTGPDVTGSGIQPTPSPAPKVCVYKGKYYTQGQKWQDGCAFDCECVDAETGNFKCVDRCLRYPNLPSTCTLVYDPANPCCQKPNCLAATPTPGPGQTPAPTVSPPTEFCVYQGVPFRQGQTFNQGCDKICVCEDAMSGKITCNDRCQTYPPLPSNCTSVADPKDACCQIPNCFNPNTITQTGVIGSFTGSNIPTPGNPYTPTGSRNVCVYQGKMYTQGQTWDDGCSYTCECLDGAKGLYKCNDKCQKFPPMPTYCRMVQDPNNKCCQTPLCNPPNPSVTPTPAPGQVTPPPQNLCVYKGSTYQQGQQWYDGCDFMCRCEDASANFYRCQQRCATYTQQNGCTLVPDPKDPTCCEIPNCPLTPPPGPTPTPGFINPNPGGVISGYGPTPSPGATLPPGTRRGCVYKGMIFHAGDKFDDGCDYECECLDDATGKYKCVEKCQTYPSLPNYCTLIQDKNKPCCKVPYCDYGPNPVLPTQGPQLQPTPQPGVPTVAPFYTLPPVGINPTPQPSVNPSPTPQPAGYCVYKGVYYTQGQTWDDGCQLRCRCEDVQKGYYSCNQRCPTYPASSCPMRADPADACCLIPDCNTGKIPTPIPTPGPGQSTMNPIVTPQPISGTFTGNSGGTQPGTGTGTSGTRNICVYKGNTYTQGQTWQDGCSYNCECIDASRGRYSCNDRCGKYPYLPAYCHWIQSSSDSCCREPQCNTYIQPTTIAPLTTPTTVPHITVPVPDKCVYINGMQYPKGATWSISCSVTCKCEDPAFNNFQCTDRCPVFSSLPAICTLVKDPSDTCCMMPQCTLPTGVTLSPLTGYGPSGSAPPPTSLQVIPLGTHTVFTGYGKPNPGTTTGGDRDKCVYKGSVYSQGQSWDDGCTSVCTCENEKTGMYRCYNKCPVYPQLPNYCKSVSVPGQCCKTITCDIPGYGIYNPVPQLVPTPLPPGATLAPGATPAPGATTPNPYIIMAPPTQSVIGKYPGGGYYLPNATNPNTIGSLRDKCLYKSRLYNQGETWDDGCDFHCECLDQRTGYYECKPLCPVYNNLPSNQCYLVTAYGQCCSQPMCYDPVKGNAVNPLTSGKFPVVGTYTGGFSGFRPGYTLPGTSTGTGHRNACIYKGKIYSKGQKWDDGCDFTCSCIDDTRGLYQCTNKCPSYTNIPPLCKLEDQPGSCCKTISCQQTQGGTMPPGFSTEMPTTAQPQIDMDCYDRISNCKDYGAQACGSQYDAWARRNCNLTCGFCVPKFSTTPPPCIDKLSDCASYQKSSCTGIYEPWAKDNCRKYCGYCINSVLVTSPNSMSTTPPACKDALDTCGLLDKTYYCTGTFHDWAIQNCQFTCGLCGVSIVTTTPVPTTPPPSSWMLFMKGVAGATGPDLYQLWHSHQTINTNVPAASHLTNEYNGHYKPDYSNHWKDMCIDMVKVSIYNQGVEKANIIFNATGADKESWYTSDRIISSTYTDIKSAPKDVMSMQGSATLGREFYISGHTSATDQCDSFGWMMISTKATGCPFEAADKKPTFYYAPGTSLAHWGFTNPLTGDVFAIQAHPNCFQPTDKPHTTTAPFCDYNGKQYTQGQYWQDGCQYNCTCEDASVGFYKCTDLCPKFVRLPAGCSLVTKPGDCCAQPDCPLSVDVSTKKPVIITGGAPACFYKNVYYTQGQTWSDGCSASCTCTDASLGLYSCRGLCLTWNNLPSICHLDDAPPGLCCQQPQCPAGIVITVPKGFEKEYPGYTVSTT